MLAKCMINSMVSFLLNLHVGSSNQTPAIKFLPNQKSALASHCLLCVASCSVVSVIRMEMAWQLSRFDSRYWMLGAGALGQPRGMVWRGRREEGSGWGAHVYLWQIRFDVWQN